MHPVAMPRISLATLLKGQMAETGALAAMAATGATAAALRFTTMTSPTSNRSSCGEHQGAAALRNWGGQGGNPCQCTQRRWTVGEADQQQTYYCTDGSGGRNGGQGVRGNNGNYGQVVLIGQMEALGPELNSIYVDMGRMEDAPIALAKNNWLQKRGALFCSRPVHIFNTSLQFLEHESKCNYLDSKHQPQQLHQSEVSSCLNGEGKLIPRSWIKRKRLLEDGRTSYRHECGENRWISSSNSRATRG